MTTALALSTATLPEWLDSLRERRLNLTITGAGPTITGGDTDPDDTRMLARHRHALEVAAAGTHPQWWATVLGRTPVAPDVQLPGTYTDPACTTCGQPAAHLDHQLLAWCDTHQEVPA